MSKDNNHKSQDDNLNDVSDNDKCKYSDKSRSGNESFDSKLNETKEKENPFSFKHFLRQETPHSSNNIPSTNGNEANHSNFNNSADVSRPLSNQLGARPKTTVPQYHSSSSSMKRSPRFSSFDSQSSLSELAEERNMHSSRSNNCFNQDYQFPSSRSYSNYHIEPNCSSSLSLSSSNNERKVNHQNPIRRPQNNGNNNANSVLPDFVQDHLLMESYYDQSHESLSPLATDDYSNCNNINNQNLLGSSRNGLADCSLDLTFNRSPNSRRKGNHTIPLDLPSSSQRSHRSNSSDLPPCDLMEGASGDVAVQREETYGPDNEPEITREQAAIDKMQTLPDFLPIYSGRLADVANINEDNSNQPLILRLQQENERLRQDLEESRQIIVDLEQQISHAKNMETQYNVTLAESMEQVEENLFACNQRAAQAQTQAKKYKDQVRQLNSEIQRLRQENESLREGCGAVGGVPLNSSGNNLIARDLRIAASTAENNLRQLLAGVENLRIIANSIDSSSQFTSNNSDGLSGDDSDDNEGPAL